MASSFMATESFQVSPSRPGVEQQADLEFLIGLENEI
jgi:hypothetical protein